MSDSIVITAARRTAIGAFQGQFASVTSPELGTAAIRAAVRDCGIDGKDVSEVLMGCVLPAGTGQAPARQASIGADLPLSVGATTLNKVCGSGMKAVMLGHDAIRAGSAEVVVAGGMESMTNAPFLVKRGLRMGHDKLLDHMFLDGLQNPYDGQMMGGFGEKCAEKYSFSREQQDDFSRASVERANRATENGLFADEITPVTVKSRKGEIEVATDEEPGRINVDKIPDLRPAFARDGTITAASSSKISDGAAALVLMSADNAAQRGVQPLARIVAHATHSQEPEWFTTAPVGALEKVLERAGWKPDEVDLYEINEAFATVTMAAMHEHGLSHDKVNIHGGACALGHPIGCSGARILVTLIHALKSVGGTRGVASLCIGGGEATAVAIELV
ncbi:MAG: acetyl-CoA C-acyltransferase [Wenzhouxiangellaceae bacterium]|nr:acetyl-CoA C-acyltransferase [Wenzhouxiangellaceae bacterium]MBS3745547.1 acetyl-CoA C-acyltransferase [Wenzhouxiangellaceae bacterium]MBS3824598.1 acetyl-CoA C-acyltransferase [Wenzhouxiangellaceae bacterium]